MSQGLGPGFDEQRIERCAACGEPLDPGTERGFAVGADETLCFGCAQARGGRWDEAQQRWVTEPETADLAGGFD